MPFDPTQLAPTKRVVSFVDEFRAFAFKGNMIDMAIAVIVGTAFGKLVESFVKNVVMQTITGIIRFFGGSALTEGNAGYTAWVLQLGGVNIQVGAFLGELVNFLLLTLVVFLFMVKLLGWIVRKREEAPAKPTRDQELLAEIRDLLKTHARP